MANAKEYQFRWQVDVPNHLIAGAVFDKYDDETGTIEMNCKFRVDEYGFYLYWFQDGKETQVLDLTIVFEVQKGRGPKDFRILSELDLHKGQNSRSNLDERALLITYGCDLVNVQSHSILAQDVDTAEAWRTGLGSAIHNFRILHVCPMTCLLKHWKMLCLNVNERRKVPFKSITKTFASGKAERMVHKCLTELGLETKNDEIEPPKFTFEKFFQLYEKICPRTEVMELMNQLSGGKEFLTVDQMAEFLNETQRDPRLNEILFPFYTPIRVKELISKYERNGDLVKEGKLSVDGFLRYLMSDENAPVHLDRIELYQDMDQPLSHYFINSSHNTYLIGRQYGGRSSVEIYRQVLISGCRCIELDCWDGTGVLSGEVIITHGKAMCTDVFFKDVIVAIKETSFITSEYPVMLSFENHCCKANQLKMANMCVEVFGDMLLTKPLDGFPLEPGVPLPSPNALKRKILIKNKRLKPEIEKIQLEQFLREGKIDDDTEEVLDDKDVVGEVGPLEKSDAATTEQDVDASSDTAQAMSVPLLSSVVNDLFYADSVTSEDDQITQLADTPIGTSCETSVHVASELNRLSVSAKKKVSCPVLKLTIPQSPEPAASSRSSSPRQGGVKKRICNKRPGDFDRGQSSPRLTTTVVRTKPTDGLPSPKQASKKKQQSFDAQRTDLADGMTASPRTTRCRFAIGGLFRDRMKTAPDAAARPSRKLSRSIGNLTDDEGHKMSRGGRIIASLAGRRRAHSTFALLGLASATPHRKKNDGATADTVGSDAGQLRASRAMSASNLLPALDSVDTRRRQQSTVAAAPKVLYQALMQIAGGDGRRSTELAHRTRSSGESSSGSTVVCLLDAALGTQHSQAPRRSLSARDAQSMRKMAPELLTKFATAFLTVATVDDSSSAAVLLLRAHSLPMQSCAGELPPSVTANDNEAHPELKQQGPFAFKKGLNQLKQFGNKITNKQEPTRQPADTTTTNDRMGGALFEDVGGGGGGRVLPDRRRSWRGGGGGGAAVKALDPNSAAQALINELEAKPVLSKEEEERLLATYQYTGATTNIHPYLSSMVNYTHPVKFAGFDVAEEANLHFHMSSFSESTGLGYLRQQAIDLVYYNKRQCTRIYPKGGRVDSSNYLPQIFWNAGCQMVSLNFQTPDLAMQLNQGKFEYNGQCGFLLKPDFMRRPDRTFDPFSEIPVDGVIAAYCKVRVISGQFLSDKKIGTYVEVDMYGLPTDTIRKEFRTKTVPANGLNPVYNEEPFTFRKVVLPELALLRFGVYDENGRLLAQRILQLDGLQAGYRHISLRSETNFPLTLPTLFVHVVLKTYVPEGLGDLVDALADPRQAVRRFKEERLREQMEQMGIHEEDIGDVLHPVDDAASNDNTAVASATTAPNTVGSLGGGSASIGGIGSRRGSADERNSTSDGAQMNQQSPPTLAADATPPLSADVKSADDAKSKGKLTLPPSADRMDRRGSAKSLAARPAEEHHRLADAKKVEPVDADDLRKDKGFVKLMKKQVKDRDDMRKRHQKQRDAVQKQQQNSVDKLMATAAAGSTPGSAKKNRGCCLFCLRGSSRCGAPSYLPPSISLPPTSATRDISEQCTRPSSMHTTNMMLSNSSSNDLKRGGASTVSGGGGDGGAQQQQNGGTGSTDMSYKDEKIRSLVTLQTTEWSDMVRRQLEEEHQLNKTQLQEEWTMLKKLMDDALKFQMAVFKTKLDSDAKEIRSVQTKKSMDDAKAIQSDKSIKTKAEKDRRVNEVNQKNLKLFMDERKRLANRHEKQIEMLNKKQDEQREWVEKETQKALESLDMMHQEAVLASTPESVV